jgi:hypothetical protein
MKRTILSALVLLCGLGADKAQSLRFVADERHDALMQFLPQTEDAWLKQLKTRKIVFYTNAEMPPAYQIWDGHLQGIHSIFYNISADKPRERFGNPNLEFPWKGPAGLDESDNAQTIKFVVLPDDQPILWWRERMRFDSHPEGTFRWIYPVGTVFGELLTIKNPDGWDYTFELRTRTRMAKSWAVNVFRPFANPDELAERIKKLEPNWRDNGPFVEWLQRDELNVSRLNNSHPRTIFDRTALVDPLPSLQPLLVAKLLTETPFKSVLGQSWRHSLQSDAEAYAPTAATAFHIVPKNYGGGFMEVTSRKCMSCHETTGMHADDFQFGRDWYGRVRGSDGIFSFHIFEPSCISGNGIGVTPQLRTELLRAGKLQQYDDYYSRQ